MKKILLLLFIASASLAQEKRVLKTNLTAPFSQIWALQYEYSLNQSLSFNITGFYRRKQSVPLAAQLDRLAKNRGLGITGVDFTHIFIDRSEVGIRGISPELRYYFGNKNNPWFVGGFAQFENFDITVPASFLIRYDNIVGEVEMPVDFSIAAISGGILIGKRWNFGKFLLDLVIVGPHVGRASKVDAEISQSLLSRLGDSDKEFLKNAVRERFKLDDKYYQVTIGNESASINANDKVPYFGLRGLGLNLGYRF